MANVKPIPDGFHTITPYLIIKGADKAIEFYKQAFGATEQMRIPGTEPGSIAHAEIKLGDSIIMMGEEHAAQGYRSPTVLGGTPVSLMLYVKDADALVKQAEAAGAKVLDAVQDKFYGDRMGTVEDPFGHVWHIATHVEDVSPEEMAKRAAAAMSG